MKHWKKGLLGALCAALILGIAIPVFGSSGTVYLMAVNDTVLDVTAENMPTVMGGVLYVPYTMLSVRDTSINLGVTSLYSSIRRTVLVSDGQTGILFNLQTNTAEDMQGNPVPARAMVRNTMPFIPIDYVCEYFDTISCSRIYSRHGTVIRLTNSAAVLRDSIFVAAADYLLAEKLQNYYASLPTAAPSPTPTAAAQPSPPPTAAPSAPPIEAEVLLALRWGKNGGEFAQVLEDRGERALFLFTAEELRRQDDAVRRLIAAGHTVGLALTGEDGPACVAELEEGRRLLGSIARYYVLVAGADALDDEGREALREKGCAVWSPDLRGEDYRSGTALVEALKPQSVSGVELDCGAVSAAFLRAALNAMEEENCTLRQVTAPLLVGIGN